MARPRPVPPGRASGARQNRSKTCWRSVGRDPRPVVVDHQDRFPALGPDGHRHHSPDRTVADRIVDEDRHELAQPGRIADDLDGTGVERDPDLRPGRQPGQAGGRIGRHVGQVDGLAGQLDRARVAPGEQEQVLDERGQVIGLGRDVVDGRADLADRLVRVPAEVLGAGPDDGQGRPQLVAGVRREFALVAERVPDRDEGATGDDGARGEGREQRHEPADRQDREERLERVPLGRDVLAHLEDVDGPGALDRHAQDADRRPLDLDRPDVAHAGLPGGLDAGVGRQARRQVEAGRPDDLAARSAHEGEGPRRRTTEGDPDGRATGTRPTRVAGDEPGEDVGPLVELGDAGRLERSGDGEVEDEPERDEDDEHDPAAPRDELPADPPEEPGVAGLGGGHALSSSR